MTPAAGNSSDAPGLWERFWRAVWEKLNSLPFVVVVLLVIVFFSVTGTIIAQEPLIQQPSMVTLVDTEVFGIPYVVELPAQYISSYGPVKAWILHFIGFTDVFHTLYYNALLIWVSVSAFVCTFKKVREAMDAQFDPPSGRPANFFDYGEHRRELEVAGLDGEEIASRLRAAGLKFTDNGEDERGGSQFLAQTGLVKRWGLVVLHVALSAIVLFAMYGALFSDEDAVPVEEGETVSFTVDPYAGTGPVFDAVLRALGAEKQDVTITLNRFDIPLNLLNFPPEWTQRPEVPADFGYFHSLTERDYKSHVAARSEGVEKQWVVEVNSPLQIAGVDIYQNSFTYTVGFELFGMPGGNQQYEVSMGRRFVVGRDGELIPAGRARRGAMTLPMSFTNLRSGDVYQDGEVVETLPPTALVEVYEPGTGRTLVRDIVSTEKPLMFTENVGLRLTDRTTPVSVFTYKVNPGIPGIYISSLLVILGAGFSLYFTYFEVYGRREGDTLQLRIIPQGLTRDPDDLMDRIEERLA